jgi:hypothetical protein
LGDKTIAETRIHLIKTKMKVMAVDRGDDTILVVTKLQQCSTVVEDLLHESILDNKMLV